LQNVTVSVTKRRFSALGNDSGYDFWKTLPFPLPDGDFRARVTIPVMIPEKRYRFRYPTSFFRPRVTIPVTILEKRYGKYLFDNSTDNYRMK